MDDSEKLRAAIGGTRESLSGLERRSLLTADPVERKRLNGEIEGIKRALFGLEKRLGALSGAPLRSGATTAILDRSEAQAVSHWIPLVISGTDPTTGFDRTTVFVSYTRADRDWAERFLDHLSPLVPRDIIDVWDETRIESGARWHEEIELALAGARVAVLLVSANFLASDDILDTELLLLLDNAREGGLLVFPIIISPCAYDRSSLRDFQAVNSPSSALIGRTRGEQEKTFAEVARLVARHLER